MRDRLDPDNPDNAELARFCPTKGQHILNPIIDWTTEEVWEFIHKYNIPYCSLYDEGFTRLGCIGCPMQSPKIIIEEFERYPKFKQAYLNAFRKMIENAHEKGIEISWKSPEEVMDWWLRQGKKE